MSTEHIKFLINAEDRATKKIRATTKDIERQVKQVRDVGSKAKASTELVGSFADAMGSSGIGQYSGEVAMLTERVSAFAEIARDGGQASIAFKAGLAGVVAVAGFKLGEALSGSAESARMLNQELERTIKLEAGFTAVKERGEAFEQFQIGLLDSAEAKRDALKKFIETKRAVDSSQAEVALQAAKDSLKEAEAVQKFNRGRLGMFEGTSLSLSNVFGDSEGITSAQAALKTAQGEVDRLKNVTANAEDQVKRLNAQIQKSAKADFGKSLTEGVMSGFNMIRDRLKENSALQEAENKAKEDAEKKLQDLKQRTFDKIKLQVVALRDGDQAARAMALGMQGIDAETANMIASAEAKLKGFNSIKEQALSPSKTKTSALIATDNRFGSGRSERNAQLRDLRTNRAQFQRAQAAKTPKLDKGKNDELLASILATLEKANEKKPIQLAVRGR